ncbi:MAG: transposase [Dehalococcoidia bacterium]|nr:transposase [Dehalococcoidia bacterium]
MAQRPNWNDSYWEKLDSKTERKLRTMCPHCGSENTYYNEHYKVWRCSNCEHAFTVNGLDKKRSWWQRLFRR